MSVTPVGTLRAVPNDPIFARDRKYGVGRNTSISSESGSSLASSIAMVTAIYSMGGKTPAQAAGGLGGGAYGSTQIGYRSV